MDAEDKKAAELEAKEQEAAAKAKRDAEPVKARVLKKGHRKVHTGEHKFGRAPETYARGDEFTIARSIGEELEDRGFVEIAEIEAEAPPAPLPAEAPPAPKGSKKAD